MPAHAADRLEEGGFMAPWSPFSRSSRSLIASGSSKNRMQGQQTAAQRQTYTVMDEGSVPDPWRFGVDPDPDPWIHD